MKESHNVEVVMNVSDGALKPALPAGMFSAIGKYSEVQAKLKQCADTIDEGPLVLHFSSHGNDDDQSIRFEGNSDIEVFAKDIAAAKPAVVILSACLTLPLGLKIWEAADAASKPTVVSWAKPVGTVVAEVFSKAFYGMIAEAAGSGKVIAKGADVIEASDPLALRKILHRVAAHEKLKKQLTVVDEPEAAATREAPKSNRSDGPPPPLNLNLNLNTTAADDEKSKAKETSSTPSMLPFFETFPRKVDVDGLAGTAGDKDSYVPVDFLRLPEMVTTIE